MFSLQNFKRIIGHIESSKKSIDILELETFLSNSQVTDYLISEIYVLMPLFPLENNFKRSLSVFFLNLCAFRKVFSLLLLKRKRVGDVLMPLSESFRCNFIYKFRILGGRMMHENGQVP